MLGLRDQVLQRHPGHSCLSRLRRGFATYGQRPAFALLLAHALRRRRAVDFWRALLLLAAVLLAPLGLLALADGLACLIELELDAPLAVAEDVAQLLEALLVFGLLAAVAVLAVRRHLAE